MAVEAPASLSSSGVSHLSRNYDAAALASSHEASVTSEQVIQHPPVCEAAALECEARFLAARAHRLRERHPKELDPRAPAVGVALSGGGVRAAAFHCGLLWALASEGFLKDVTHLAAVSGGGYTAASLATHLLQAADGAAAAPSLNSWYQEVTARTILRMQRNINYMVGCSAADVSCASRTPEEVGRAVPRICDLPMFLLTMLGSVCVSPALIATNAVWPVVLSIERTAGGILRAAWCDPVQQPYITPELLDWVRGRFLYGSMGMAGAAVLVALLRQLGCGRQRPPHYTGYLFWRSLQQVLVRGALCYTIFTIIPLLLLQMQHLTWGAGWRTLGDRRSWALNHCWRFVNSSMQGLSTTLCPDHFGRNRTTWYEIGDGTLYCNASWVAANGVRFPTGVDPAVSASRYDTPMFLGLNAAMTAAGLLGLLFGLPLLKWVLTVAGPLWAAFLVAQVAQWRIFGPVTGQALIAGNFLHYTDHASWWVFQLCTMGAILTLPVHDTMLKLAHYYYRRCLQVAFFHNGKDVSFASLAQCPYAPNLLLGACVNDYRRPDETQLLCDFTCTPLFLGCPRTGFFPTDPRMRLGYLVTIGGAAPDTFMLTKLDVLPVRVMLSVLSLRFGDFVRLEPDGPVAVHVGSAVRRLSQASFGPHRMATGQKSQSFAQRVLDRAVVACPFMLCHLLLLVGQFLNDGRASCDAYDWLTKLGTTGFIAVLVLSFFAWAPKVRWLMRSPLILQFQMMFMHRHQATRPPPYLYLSDGGLIECLGVLMLLRRRVPLIICSDACEDAPVSLRALQDSIDLARAERLCSFFDPADPRRNVEHAMSELRDSHVPYLRLGIRYEPAPGQDASAPPATGELLYIRMRLAHGDTAPVRPLLTEDELLRPPQAPPGTAFCAEDGPGLGSCKPEVSRRSMAYEPMARSTTSLPLLAMSDRSAEQEVRHAQLPPPAPGGQYRRDLEGTCCLPTSRWARWGGRRFPDFGTGNQCLQPHHFANLCALGAEMSLPVVRHAAAALREGSRQGTGPATGSRVGLDHV